MEDADKNPKAILYSFRRCPYAMRARMALRVSQFSYEHREIALKNKPAEMLRVSPKGTVPVLVLPDGRVLDESLDVMRFALAQSDPEGWVDASLKNAGSPTEDELLLLNDGDFKRSLDHYKYHTRFPERSQQSYREEAEEVLRVFEEQLKKNNGVGLLAPNTRFVDIAIFPFVRQFSRVEPEWFEASPYPKLRAWLRAHEQSALFLSIMKKHPLWAP